MEICLHTPMTLGEIFGGTYEIRVDRPMGYRHIKDDGTRLDYPINYGEIPSIEGGDGEPQDVYILGVGRPIETFRGRIIAVIHRLDDNEDKWVTSPEEKTFSEAEILEAVRFQEQYYHSVIIMRPEAPGPSGGRKQKEPKKRTV